MIPALLLILFLWFLISPILRNKNVIAPAAGKSNVDAKGISEDQHEKATLLDWMRRRSCGRFADTEGNHNVTNTSYTQERGTEASRRFSLSTMFARSSLIPHIPPARPQPLYTTATQDHSLPAVSSPLARPPLECLPHRQGMLNVPRTFVPARHISLRSYSGTALLSTQGMPRPQMAPHFASDSDAAFTSSSRASGLASWLTMPSKAFLPAHISVTDAGSLIDKATRTLNESTFSERDMRSKGAAFPF